MNFGAVLFSKEIVVMKDEETRAELMHDGNGDDSSNLDISMSDVCSLQ